MEETIELQELFLLCILLALPSAECTLGIILNLFIVVTNIQNWRRLNMLPTCDEILICLATSRCLLLFHVMFLLFLGMFFPQLFQILALISSTLVITMLLNHINLWFATILCVFYCVKITNYNHRFFTILKTKISSLVHWFLLASLTISIGCSLPFGGFVVDLDLLEFTSISAENMTFTKVESDKTTQNVFLILFVGSLPPFVIFCVANFLLIWSLWTHVRRMRSSGTGSPNLEVHFSAVKSMTLFLVLQVIYFTCMTLQMSPALNNNFEWKAGIFIIICSPPFLHSPVMLFHIKALSSMSLWSYNCPQCLDLKDLKTTPYHYSSYRETL